MANISAGMVKELRDQTGAGMMDCKAALTENDGNLEAAVDWLRKKGLSKAAKKAGRVAAEGLIGIAITATKGVVVEVNSETDFVARNDLFQGLVKMIANAALDTGPNVDKILAAKAGSITIADVDRRHHRQGRREHDVAPRRRAFGRQGRRSRSYVHNSVVDGLGRIGVIVALEFAGNADELKAFGRMVAMHVASANPLAIDPSGLDPAAIEREKNVLAEKFKAQGKPANVIEKIVEFGAEDLLQGGLPARAGLHFRRQEIRAAGRQGSRRQSRRADQGHRLRALCARRGHRQARPAISAAKSRRWPVPIKPAAFAVGFGAQTR